MLRTSGDRPGGAAGQPARQRCCHFVAISRDFSRQRAVFSGAQARTIVGVQESAAFIVRINLGRKAMFKRIIMAVVIVAAFAIGAATPDTADARWGRRVRVGRPVVVAPRVVAPRVVVARPYYPLRYGVGYRPYWGPRYDGAYYGPGVYVGW
jgi:hypothetical protein